MEHIGDPSKAIWSGGKVHQRSFGSNAEAQRFLQRVKEQPGTHDAWTEKGVVGWTTGGSLVSPSLSSSRRMVPYEEVFPTEREAVRYVERLSAQPDVSGIKLDVPRAGNVIGWPFLVEWIGDDGSTVREGFRSLDDAENRAAYLGAGGIRSRVVDTSVPGFKGQRVAQLPRVERVKHRLTEYLPFLVIYQTTGGAKSKSFERETQAKAAAEALAGRGTTAAVYALTRDGKKIPIGYYKPNDGLPVAADPVAAQAEKDAKAAPPAAVVATATPNLRQKVTLSPTGIPMIVGKRWGHPRPPSRYRRMGAVHARDYAYPERFMYPLYFHDASGKLNVAKSRKHVANAKTRFSAQKHRYSAAIRSTIASNINKAARRVGLAADVRP
jgi:hypothetical protein